ncbi:unnamed protein product [Arctia plantaginis]|uniref:Uncharacterized protein n=1 Tax=Arctia plantaginis TaxID=874455 RepID=A0A8S0Z5I7_ARCPL|nr:unnamed protein product [Arctia plantaginis]CAB3228161.1 unnamed protein product [Arctia plantaginis]
MTRSLHPHKYSELGSNESVWSRPLCVQGYVRGLPRAGRGRQERCSSAPVWRRAALNIAPAPPAPTDSHITRQRRLRATTVIRTSPCTFWVNYQQNNVL